MYICTYIHTYVCTYIRTYVRKYVCTYRAHQLFFQPEGDLMHMIILLHAMSSRRSQNKSARHQRAAAMSSAISKQSFIFQLFRVFQAEHSLCSKQNILCVRSRTFLVFEARHSSCSKQDISCVPSRRLCVVQAGGNVLARKIVLAPNISILPLKIRHFSSSIF